MCLHQAPGQRRSEGPPDVGNQIGGRDEASLSTTQMKTTPNPVLHRTRVRRAREVHVRRLIRLGNVLE